MGISLNKSLSYSGVSKAKWYYTKKSRSISLNQTIVGMVQKTGASRPTYGTRRMAATISKLVKPVNRKQIQRIYRKLGWIEPAKSKNEIIRSKKKRLKPTAPNRLW